MNILGDFSNSDMTAAAGFLLEFWRRERTLPRRKLAKAAIQAFLRDYVNKNWGPAENWPGPKIEHQSQLAQPA